MFKKSSLIALVFLTQIVQQAGAADALAVNDLTENDFFNDLPVVLTATRLKQSKKDSPIASTVIDREMIEASGFTEIADLLRLAPGMLVNYHSGHIVNAGYQFLFDRFRVRLQVLVDGMSVFTPSFGEMPWTQLGITIDDIERIEVIRGPSSASYGPNAMTGVISIITRHAALDGGLKFKANEGVNGRSERYLSVGSSEGNFDFKLSLGARKDDGFERRYDSKDLSIANFRGDYQATNNDVITFSFSNNSGDYQEDASDGLYDAMPEHVKSVKQATQQSKWVHSFSDGDNFTLNYYQQTFDDNNNFDGDFGNIMAGGYGIVPISESVSTNRENLEVTYSTYSDAVSLTVGGLYRSDDTLAPEYLNNINKNVITRQLFVNTEFHLNEDNVINVGVLRDDNDTGGTTTSPRIAFNHQINKNHMTRISYAEATRSPFALEEYLNRVVWVPDIATSYTLWSDLSDLKPEQIKSLDIGYIAMLNNNSTEIDVRIYKNELTDIIILDGTNFTGGFLQGDEFDISGLETTVTHRFDNTKVVFNYARTKISAGDLLFGQPFWYETGAPKDSASFLFMHNFANKVKASAGYYYTSSYQQLCCESDQQDPRKRLDFTLSKLFKLGKYYSKLKLVLQNVTNEKVETRLYNNYDRQGYISFSIGL